MLLALARRGRPEHRVSMPAQSAAGPPANGNGRPGHPGRALAHGRDAPGTDRHSPTTPCSRSIIAIHVGRTGCGHRRYTNARGRAILNTLRPMTAARVGRTRWMHGRWSRAGTRSRDSGNDCGPHRRAAVRTRDAGGRASHRETVVARADVLEHDVRAPSERRGHRCGRSRRGPELDGPVGDGEERDVAERVLQGCHRHGHVEGRERIDGKDECVEERIRPDRRHLHVRAHIDDDHDVGVRGTRGECRGAGDERSRDRLEDGCFREGLQVRQRNGYSTRCPPGSGGRGGGPGALQTWRRTDCTPSAPREHRWIVFSPADGVSDTDIERDGQASRPRACTAGEHPDRTVHRNAPAGASCQPRGLAPSLCSSGPVGRVRKRTMSVKQP